MTMDYKKTLMNKVLGIFQTIDFELLHQDTIFNLNRQIKDVDDKKSTN